MVTRKQCKHLLWEYCRMKGVEGLGRICRIESHWGEDAKGNPKPGEGEIHIWIAFDHQTGSEWEKTKSYTLPEFNKELEYMIGADNGQYWNEADFEDVLSKHESALGWKDARSTPGRVLSVISRYQRRYDEAMAGTKSFVEEMRIHLRSMGIVADMVSRASSHNEKNARLRGLIEVIEGAIHDLTNKDFERHYTWNEYENVFKSKYPVQRLLDGKMKLENEVERLKATLKENGIEVEDEMPF